MVKTLFLVTTVFIIIATLFLVIVSLYLTITTVFILIMNLFLNHNFLSYIRNYILQMRLSQNCDYS